MLGDPTFFVVGEELYGTPLSHPTFGLLVSLTRLMYFRGLVATQFLGALVT